MSTKPFQRRKWPILFGFVIMVLALLLLGQPTSKAVTAAPELAPDALSVSGVANGYAPVTGISGATVTVGALAAGGSATPFAIGDYALLIQMTGAPPPHGGSLGLYEMQQVTAVGAGTVTLAAIGNTYEFATEKVQLVRVPFDADITVTGAVTAMPWDGATGGIVALKGTTLTMNADIDASGSGFVAGTNTNAPWSAYNIDPTFTAGFHADSAARASLSSGIGSTNGRGNDGDGANGGKGGGGLGGGGGVAPGVGKGDGGGKGGGGKDANNILAVGLAGGIGNRLSNDGGNGGGGGGGIIGGGGGGAAGANTAGGGGGGGVAGGGSGGVKDGSRDGGGGGGYGSIGTGSNVACLDSCGAAGGGSYGGGGGSAASEFGGDDGGGGGGGGSWSGGGSGGTKGGSAGQDGGDGNTPVSSAISDSDHYLNNTNPRLILGESGGSSVCANGGSGGGIVLLDFNTVNGNSNFIQSNGQAAAATPTTCDPLLTFANPGATAPFGAGGAGGGAGGQMRLTVQTWTSTSVSAAGGNGGDGNSNGEYHGGVSGGGAGGGGIWFDGVSSFTGGNTNTGGGNPAVPGVTSWGIGGGSAGASTNNPKNDLATATSGSGGNGLVVVSLAADWGDLPDSFDTTATNSGPYHTITSNLYLGSCVDAETNGQPDAQAGNAGGGSGNGDDGNASAATGSCTNNDDEDGVTLVTPLIPGAQACVEIDAVNSGATATLYGWIDFNGDGDFDGDANEKLTFTSGGTVSGSVTNQKACFTVPAAATFDGGETHMRFRLTRDTLSGGTPWNGSANNGEVEDYWTQLACVGNYLWIDTGTVPNAQDATDTAVTDGTAVDLVWGGPDGNIATTGDNVTYSTTTTSGLYNFCGLTADPNGNGNPADDNYQIVVPTPPATPVTPNDTDDVHDSDCNATGEMPEFTLPDPPTSLPTGENGNGDNPGGWGYPDGQDNQTFDCGFMQIVYDWGDAPDSYGTDATNGGEGVGPSHPIDPTLGLGPNIDDETEGQPSAGADGDDNNGTPDDEDGVDFGINGPMAGVCTEDNPITITYHNDTGSNAYVYAWMDFNDNGVFDNPAELIVNAAVAADDNNAGTPLNLTYDIPCNAVPTTTSYVRVRIDTAASGVLPTGPGSIGEVEDYLYMQKGWDFGDVTDFASNQTVHGQPFIPVAAGPARHLLIDDLVLGSCVDMETDGTAPATPPMGDDNTDTADSPFTTCTDPDDEDGFSGRSLDWSSGSGDINVTVSNVPTAGACVYGYIDWDRDGFMADDGNATNGGNSYVMGMATGDGPLVLTFNSDLPASGSFPTVDIPLRLRVVAKEAGGACSSPPSPVGPMTGGEVEDHKINFSTPTAVNLRDATAMSTSNLLWISAAVLVLLTGIVLRLRRRKEDLH